MCFSPSVSFGASVVLAGAGIAAVVRSRTLPQKTLAIVPLLFALQQCSEGILWLSLLHPGWARWQPAATYTFLFFAQMVWPVYMPVCAMVAEHARVRKFRISITLYAGIILAIYTGIALGLYPPVAIAERHHIRYELHFTLAQQWYYGVLYFIPAVVSLLLSSQKPLRWLGCLFFISYLCTRLLFHFYVISVWCFFGAAISVLILVWLPRIHKKETNRP